MTTRAERYKAQYEKYKAKLRAFGPVKCLKIYKPSGICEDYIALHYGEGKCDACGSKKACWLNPVITQTGQLRWVADNCLSELKRLGLVDRDFVIKWPNESKVLPQCWEKKLQSLDPASWPMSEASY